MTTSPDPLETVIFIHIPKTAGSTIRSLIAQNYAFERTLAFSGKLEEHAWFRRQSPDFFRRLHLIHGHHPYGVHECLPQRAVYFTFLREPLARYFSDYFFAKEYPPHNLHKEIVSGALSLSDYGRLCEENVYFDNLMTQYLSGRFFEQPGEETLETAKSHLAHTIAVCGLAERFDESVLRLARRLGWRHPFHITKNVSRETLTDVPLEVRTRTEARLGLDRRLYQYAQTLFEEALAAEPPEFADALAEYREIEHGLHHDYDRNRHRIYVVRDGVDHELQALVGDWPARAPALARYLKIQ